MILFAVSNIEIIFLVVIGLLLIGLVGIGLIHYTKTKMEQELDELTVSSTNMHEEEPAGELLDIQDTPNLESVIEEEPVEQHTKEHLSEIEILLEQMQSDLQRQDKEPIHTFEEEQEEKSIISYQELKAMKDNHIHEDEIMKYEQEQEEHSVLSEPDIYYHEEETEVPLPSLKEAGATINKRDETKKSFSNSDFISPVYGKMDTGKLDYPKIPNFKEEFHIDHNEDEIMFDDVTVKLKGEEEPDLEHTFDLGPMSDEIKKNDEFLKALKEFRNNLE